MMHRRPLGRGRTLAMLAGVLLVVGCVLPGWQVGGTPGIPAQAGNGFAGSGILVFLGLRMSRRSPWLGATLISVGAVAGALPIFWTILALVVAVALVVLSIMYARRAAGASPAPG